MASRAEIEIVLSNGSQAGRTINELTAQSAKLAREIKKMEIGSNEFVQSSEDFKQVSSRLKDVKKEAFDTAQAQGELNSMFKDMIPFQAEFARLAVGIKGAGAAIKLTTGLTNLFKLALAATGIGLVVIGLASLVAWLRKTQAGMDFVGKVTAAAGAAFKVIIDRALAFGSAMANLATGNFGAAVDDLTKTFSGLGKELKNETAAAYQMEGALQDIVRAEKQIEVQKSRSRAEIEKLKMVAEDQTKSEQERLNAAQQAFAIENKLLGDSIALQEKKLKTIQDQNALGTSTDEDRNKEFDVEIELNNMREESFTKQTELQNKINELKRSGVVVSKEVAVEEISIVKENLEAQIKEREAFVAKSIEAELKENEARKTIDAEMLAGFKAQQQEKFDSKMAALVTMNEAEQMMIDELFLTNQLSQEERDLMLYDSQKKALTDRLALMIANGEQTSQTYKDLYMNLLQLNYEYEANQTAKTKEEEAKRKTLRDQGLAAAAGVFAGLATLFSQNTKNRKKNFAAIKAIQAAEIAANTALEISNIWSTKSIFPEPFATIAKVVQTGLATARGAMAVSKINSIEVQGGDSFAEGGVVKGPSHQAGGIKFSAGGQLNEMEGNEIILTKGVYQSPVLRAMASELNVMGGGRSFALGGPVLQDRGLMNTSSQSSAGYSSQPTGQSPLAGFGRMEEVLNEIAINTRVTAEKPVLAVTQIREKLQMLQDTEQDAQF